MSLTTLSEQEYSVSLQHYKTLLQQKDVLIEQKDKDIAMLKNRIAVLESRGDKKKRSKTEDDEQVIFPDSLNTDTFKECWADWISHRKDNGHPISNKYQNKALKQLKRYEGEFICSLIQKGIINHYQGLCFDSTPIEYERYLAGKKKNEVKVGYSSPGLL